MMVCRVLCLGVLGNNFQLRRHRGGRKTRGKLPQIAQIRRLEKKKIKEEIYMDEQDKRDKSLREGGRHQGIEEGGREGIKEEENIRRLRRLEKIERWRDGGRKFT